MEPLEQRVLTVLQQHQGREQAILVRELELLLSVPPRRLRAAVARLVTECRLPLASTVHPPYGFYIITSAQEARECLAQYWSRIEELARRARILAGIVKERFGLSAVPSAAQAGVESQLELRFDERADQPTT